MSTPLSLAIASLSAQRNTIGQPVLNGKRVGLEKENLRVQSNGVIAVSDHPSGLGSALCNPYITTDYSEALLELVTPALHSVPEALDFLAHIQNFVQSQLPDDEVLWNTSMPCVLDGPEHIRIGCYGTSNSGTMKTVYRRGLGLRYGKAMQTIAGVHFNHSWSTPTWKALANFVADNPAARSELSTHAESLARQTSEEEREQSKAGISHPFVSEGYLAVTRNLLRNTWLIPLLFGASPAVCKTFLDGGDPVTEFEVFNGSTYFQRYATSLRMGDIGYNYSKKAAASISVDYSSLDTFTRDLYRLITTRHDGYHEMGLKDAEGEYQQLNTNLLQIENEYYAAVRPKQLAGKMEPPVLAMRNRGIMYAELRCLDVNVFEPVGMNEEQLLFLEIFMLHALLTESPMNNSEEMTNIGRNMSMVAHRGRDPEATLNLGTKKVPVRDAALALLDDLQEVAEFMDNDRNAHGESGITGDTDHLYRNALKEQRLKVEDFSLTPSARVLDELFASHNSFHDLARAESEKASSRCSDLSVDKKTLEKISSAVAESVAKQQQMESDTATNFEDFLADYFKTLEKQPL